MIHYLSVENHIENYSVSFPVSDIFLIDTIYQIKGLIIQIIMSILDKETNKILICHSIFYDLQNFSAFHLIPPLADM